VGKFLAKLRRLDELGGIYEVNVKFKWSMAANIPDLMIFLSKNST
jgi:hypothetical protein